MRLSALCNLRAFGCVLVVAGLIPATANATITFGADISRPVDSTVTCAAQPLPGVGSYPENMGSCTWLTENINVNTFLTAESIQVPAGKGVITAVRVKEGDNTGPMKITILRAQGFATSTTPVACCIGAAESQVFTPAADAITTVPVDISVFNGTNPATGVPEVDYMAITVLDDTTDVPLSNVHSEGEYLGSTFYPALTVGQERLDGGFTNYGYIALINADWQPVSTKPVATAPSNTSAPLVTGGPIVGQSVSATLGVWSGTTPMTYAYQWQRCNLAGCVSIPGATRYAYQLVAADLGANVRIVVSATNSAGTTSAASAETRPVAPSTAQIAALMQSELAPSGKAAKIAAILKARGYTFSCSALESGVVAVGWYLVPRGAHLTSGKQPTPTLVASGRRSFSGAGTAKLTVKLTAAGKASLKHARTLRLTAKGTFTPPITAVIRTTRNFTLKR
jgi:hypothetical protein